MADTRFIEETFSSRFKMTELLEEGGNLLYGLWEPPDIEITGNEQTYIVPPEHENRIDMVSYIVYGDVNLWWVLAYVNNIELPMRDLVAGTRIIIPSLDTVNSALQRVRK